jgi:hypothetical protein
VNNKAPIIEECDLCDGITVESGIVRVKLGDTRYKICDHCCHEIAEAADLIWQ